jgi:hypothetical protein
VDLKNINFFILYNIVNIPDITFVKFSQNHYMLSIKTQNKKIWGTCIVGCITNIVRLIITRESPLYLCLIFDITLSKLSKNVGAMNNCFEIKTILLNFPLI